jgi:hypothetical protein
MTRNDLRSIMAKLDKASARITTGMYEANHVTREGDTFDALEHAYALTQGALAIMRDLLRPEEYAINGWCDWDDTGAVEVTPNEVGRAAAEVARCL